MKTKFLFFFLFRIFCYILFLHQATMTIMEFSSQKPSSNPKFDQQEHHPRPLVCLSTSKFDYHELNTRANITFNDYRWGRWKTDEFTEEELFNFLSANLSSLIRELRIYRNTDPFSNSYETSSQSSQFCLLHRRQ